MSKQCKSSGDGGSGASSVNSVNNMAVLHLSLMVFFEPRYKLGWIVLYCSLQEILDYFEEETTPEIPTIGSREGQLFIAV